MATGRTYRVGSLVGVALFAAAAVLVTNLSAVQWAFTRYAPLFGARHVVVLEGRALGLAVALTVGVTVACLHPLYRPRPRRKLDTIALAVKRVAVATVVLAAIGYLVWSLRIPRTTLTMTSALLLACLPAWFALIRTGSNEPTRAVVVGDDPGEIQRVLETARLPIIGYLAPSTLTRRTDPLPTTDGGVAPANDVGRVGAIGSRRLDQVQHLGGLSRLEDVLVERDVDTVVLAFGVPDRKEFFGALDTCHDYGVTVLVHRAHTDSVLLAEEGPGDLVEVALEPWDWQEYAIKRAFDVAFAGVGLVILSPVMAVIAATIKLEDGGPVHYAQERTSGFGGTFTVRKFRTMDLDGESASPIDDDENDRITRVGRTLRRSHLDEIPQLWSILEGDMSVVGPRPVWTDEEVILEAEVETWRKRWFVKPGLTGLAQVNDVSSTEPEAKIRYDLEYIRRQSFWFDLKIVVRQLWSAFVDVLVLLADRTGRDRESGRRAD